MLNGQAGQHPAISTMAPYSLERLIMLAAESIRRDRLLPGNLETASHVGPPLERRRIGTGPRLCHATDMIWLPPEGPAHTTTIVHAAADIQAESNYMY